MRGINQSKSDSTRPEHFEVWAEGYATPTARTKTIYLLGIYRDPYTACLKRAHFVEKAQYSGETITFPVSQIDTYKVTCVNVDSLKFYKLFC